MTKTDRQTELSILAMLARGDTYQSISEAMGVAVPTISVIKKRNGKALSIIQDKLISHQASKSAKILDKTHDLIDKRLDKASRADRERQDLLNELETGKITVEEFKARWSTIYEPTLTELNGISREAFNQSQIEQGKPTSISNTPKAKEELVELLEALKGGDELEMYKLVLSPQREIIEGEIVE